MVSALIEHRGGDLRSGNAEAKGGGDEDPERAFELLVDVSLLEVGAHELRDARAFRSPRRRGLALILENVAQHLGPVENRGSRDPPGVAALKLIGRLPCFRIEDAVADPGPSQVGDELLGNAHHGAAAGPLEDLVLHLRHEGQAGHRGLGRVAVEVENANTLESRQLKSLGRGHALDAEAALQHGVLENRALEARVGQERHLRPVAFHADRRRGSEVGVDSTMQRETVGRTGTTRKRSASSASDLFQRSR